MAKKNELKKSDSTLPVSAKQVRELMVAIRGKNTLIDSDVAAIYGIETKRVNEAVRNNPDKFPEGYIFETTDEEKRELTNEARAA